MDWQKFKTDMVDVCRETNTDYSPTINWIESRIQNPDKILFYYVSRVATDNFPKTILDMVFVAEKLIYGISIRRGEQHRLTLVSNEPKFIWEDPKPGKVEFTLGFDHIQLHIAEQLKKADELRQFLINIMEK